MRRLRREANDELATTLRPQWEPVVLANGADPESVAFAVVPGTTAPLVDVPEARRASLRQNLENLVASPPDDAHMVDWPTDEAEVSLAHQAACTACRGQCCGGGENHGYLRAGDISRYADARCAGDEAEAIAQYVAIVPEQTVEDSCIFHGPHGCVLHRSMRNGICNSMRCSALVELDASVAEGASSVVAVALGPSRENVRRIGLSSGSSVTVVDTP